MKDIKEVIWDIEKHGYDVGFRPNPFSLEGSEIIVTEAEYYHVAISAGMAIEAPLDYIMKIIKDEIDNLKAQERRNQTMNGYKQCSRCKENKLNPIEVRNALSRRDNTTYICSDCGRDEAIEDMIKAGVIKGESK